MRWRINQFTFCERQQTLASGENIQQLEPMVVELLAYFCRHRDQIVSREHLIIEVWSGRLITDNAVTKVVTKLRKHFNDDPRKPQFIATFPKKGYKFIAAVVGIEETLHQSIDAEPSFTSHKNEIATEYSSEVKGHTTNSKTIPVFPLLLMFTVVVALLVIMVSWPLSTKPQTLTQVKALTRDPGRESRPRVSPDGQYLAYTEVHQKKMRQWIKSLADETTIEVSHGEATDTWVDSLTWNSDASTFAYLVTTPKSCQYYTRNFNRMSLGRPQLIHNCPAGSYGKIAFTHDDNRLVYSEAAGPNKPFELFEINLDSGVKRKLNQPELFLGGNSQFDLHPHDNKLLISSPDKQQWEGFYSLDLDSDELRLLFKQDAYICCGIWSHNGERIVLMGEHPATQIESFDLKGKNKHIVYSGNGQVRSPERHINGKDYLFSITHTNQDAFYTDINNSVSAPIANTSVDDRLATFSQKDNQIAYIGLGSGNEEVWITDIHAIQRKKLTNFKDSRHYIDLLWSYNGEYLIGLTLNEIHLISAETGVAQALKIPQVEIRGISWKDNLTVSYSIELEGIWRVFYYDIRSHRVLPEEESWQFIRYTESNSDILWIDQYDKVFFGKEQLVITDNDLLEVNFLSGRTFNLKKSGTNWAWQNRVDGRYQLMMKNEADQTSNTLLVTDSYYFDFSEKGLLFHRVEAVNADIYQTVNQ